MTSRSRFLAASEALDFDEPGVAAKAAALARGAGAEFGVIRRCFLFVRDEVRHCWDHRADLAKAPVTYRASEVLREGHGWCFAKSHLLAALLRANGINAGLCYQRLSVKDDGPPHSLHGLNAVWLDGVGWLRIDARGNKPGVAAEFDPPRERIAFPATLPGEADLPEVWGDPHPAVTRCLTSRRTNREVYENLPDVPLLFAPTPERGLP